MEGLIPVLIIVFSVIYRLVTGKWDESGAGDNFSVHETERQFDDDYILNPAFSFLKYNMFHRDRYEN